MVKLIRFIGLVSQSIFLQFVHVIGFVAFIVSAAFGWYRLPSWAVPLLAVGFGVISDKFFDLSDVTGLLDKAHDADKRGGFLILVYFVICAVGYVTGGYGRHYLQSKNGTPAAAKK